jgi:hypothetical protein
MAQVTGLRLFYLVWARRLGRVRPDYGSRNWVKAFSSFEGDRVSRVKLG